MRVAIAGAGGRMGRTVGRLVLESGDLQLVAGLEANGSPYIGADVGTLAGLGPAGVKISNSIADVVTRCDAVIDFTIPAASVELSDYSAKAQIVHVIGTTGLSDDDNAKIREASRRARIVKSGNMSLGVNILASLVRKTAAALGSDFDIEIVEMHHRHKIDSPSGTALLLGEAAASGRNVELGKSAIRSRDGQTGVRPQGAIGFASLRGGSVIGEHSVIFAGQAERIELTHKAESRDIFARGAVRAALWAMNQEPGFYTMADVLGLDS